MLDMAVEELGDLGLERMDDAEIRSFLGNQKIGVLGLPTTETPYLVPMSYGYDCESRIYFTYVTGEESNKANLSDATERASFLVSSVETPYNWQSVQLTGSLQRVPDEQWDDLGDVLAAAWRPDLFQQVEAEAAVGVYEFEILEQSGIKHRGLPPGLAPE